MSKIDTMKANSEYLVALAWMRVSTECVQVTRQKLLHCGPAWIKYYRRLFDERKELLRRDTERFARLYIQRYGGLTSASRNTEGKP